jgi:hypothetical protein
MVVMKSIRRNRTVEKWLGGLHTPAVPVGGQTHIAELARSEHRLMEEVRSALSTWVTVYVVVPVKSAAEDTVAPGRMEFVVDTRTAGRAREIDGEATGEAEVEGAKHMERFQAVISTTEEL